MLTELSDGTPVPEEVQQELAQLWEVTSDKIDAMLKDSAKFQWSKPHTSRKLEEDAGNLFLTFERITANAIHYHHNPDTQED